MDKNILTYFCSSYYNNLQSVNVIDHNETTHLSESLEHYYVARISVDGNVLIVTTNYKEFDSCTNLHEMCDVLDNNLYRALFQYNKVTKKDIDDYFSLLGGTNV